MSKRAKTRKMKEPALVQLGRMFAEMRRAKELSQERFGDLVDVNPKYYAQIERGEKNIGFTTLNQILSRGHGLTLNSLFFGLAESERKRENARMIALFHVFLRRASRRERLALFGFLEIIAKEPR